MWDKWARVLVQYSLGVRPRQRFLIAADPSTMPLVDACYREGLSAGAFVQYLALPSHHKEILFSHAQDYQLEETPFLWKRAVEETDAYLIILSEMNTRALSHIPQSSHVLYSKGYQPVRETIFRRYHEGSLRWCLTQFPSPAFAQEANMGTYDYQDFTFSAAFLDHEDPVASWKKLAESQQRLADRLAQGRILTFRNDEGTDLEVDVSGMRWVNNAGSTNFPDGEIFTGPNLSVPRGGVNGTVVISFPTIWKQVEVSGIRLTFERGAVVEAFADENEDFLKAMINQDPGARYVGEIALGTNYAVQRGTRNVLFDEKIGGTFHLALGSGYPQTGNTNSSALHWDLVVEMRKSGQIALDGALISQRGRFVDPGWPQPFSP